MRAIIALTIAILSITHVSAVDAGLLDHPRTRAALTDSDVGLILRFTISELYASIKQDSMACIHGTVLALDDRIVHIAISPGIDPRPLLGAELLIYDDAAKKFKSIALGRRVTKDGIDAELVGDASANVTTGDRVQNRL